MSKAQRKPRCAPSLRMVRLIGPTGIEAKISAQTKPASADNRTGCVSAMSVRRPRFVFVLFFNFLPPRARNVRSHKTVEQIGGEENRQDVIQNLLAQNQHCLLY